MVLFIAVVFDTRMVLLVEAWKPVPFFDTTQWSMATWVAVTPPSRSSEKIPALVLPEITESEIVALVLVERETPVAQLRTCTLLSTTLVVPERKLLTTVTPAPAMFLMVVFETLSRPPPLRASRMPLPVPPKLPSIRQSSTKTSLLTPSVLPVMLMPRAPASKPLKLIFRRRTDLLVSPAPKLSNAILTPFDPADLNDTGNHFVAINRD